MNICTRYRSLSLAFLLFVLAGGACDRNTAITARTPDAFYDPPAEVPAAHGVLLRSEPLKKVVFPTGMQGWRILYTTSVDDQTPAIAVATVFAPKDLPAGPRPVITWEHGTTGLMQECMPSLVTAPMQGIPAVGGIWVSGWVVVATDYSFAEKGGPHPYLIGEGEARAALDAVRAARQMPELTLDTRTVVWGHSQGGHAALWTGIIGPKYAPDVEILSVVAIAPAANIMQIMTMNPTAEKRLGPYIAQSYSRFYPDIKFEEAVRPEALSAARAMVSLCGFFPPEDPKRIAELAQSFDGPVLALSTNRALAARIEQNTANGPMAVPVVIMQGLADKVVPPPATEAYFNERCKTQMIEYWTFADADHATIVAPGSPLERPLVSWTTARFASEPYPRAPICLRLAR